MTKELQKDIGKDRWRIRMRDYGFEIVDMDGHRVDRISASRKPSSSERAA